MLPSKLKININGTLKSSNNANESTTSFCSCLFFILTLLSINITKNSVIKITLF